MHDSGLHPTTQKHMNTSSATGNHLSKDGVTATPIGATTDTSDHATDAPPPISAVHKVLAIPELLEQISLPLPMRDLFVVTRMNRGFRDVIKDSKHVKPPCNSPIQRKKKGTVDNFAALYSKAKKDPGSRTEWHSECVYLSANAIDELCPSFLKLEELLTGVIVGRPVWVHSPAARFLPV